MSDPAASTEGIERPPRLSEDGARRLAEALQSHERHDTARARAGAHRRSKDPLRGDAGNQTPHAHQNGTEAEDSAHADAPPVARPRGGAFFGPLVIGLSAVAVVVFAVVAGLIGGDDAGFAEEVATEVAGEVEFIDDTVERTEVDRSAPAESSVVTAESTSETVARSVVSSEDAAPASLILDPGMLALAVYDVDPVQSGVRTFAIRVRNVNALEDVDTERLDIQVQDAAGNRVPALFRFEHSEVPQGSSAIASVRVEGSPPGEAVVILRHDGVDVASAALPS